MWGCFFEKVVRLCVFWNEVWQKPPLAVGTNRRAPANGVAHAIRTVAAMLGRRAIWRRAILATVCWLGLTEAWFFMAFLLLDTMFQYPMLENVLKAVMIPIKSLSLTFVLGVIIM